MLSPRDSRCRAAVASLVAVIAASALTASVAEATSGSILYRKSGKLWVAGADGKRARPIPRSVGLESPSQDDRGNIVAQRGVNLHRMNRRGRALNKPFTTPFRTNRVLPAFNGPFSPEVSPDGRTIAYTYAFTASHYDYACNCFVTTPSMNTTFTRSNRQTNDPASSLGLSNMYSNASWIDSRTVMMTTPSLYDFGGNILDTVAIDRLGGGKNSYQRWFAECIGCESIETLELYRLDEGEMTRRRDRMVFVSGELGSEKAGSLLLLYELGAGAPPAVPQHFCRFTGASGSFSSPSWSPDGRKLAWADGRGIWIGDVGDLSGDVCQVRKRLAIPGGTSPDWGPAPARR